MRFEQARILILCKTYPSPSSRYAETSCVAGVSDKGNLIRLYPVPFRMITEDKKFKKWQWITAQISKTRSDHRNESFRVNVDSIICNGAPITTKNNWMDRLKLIEHLQVFRDLYEIENSRSQEGTTLAILKTNCQLKLEISKADTPDWTLEEQNKLVQLQNRLDLFDQTDRSNIRLLRKIPYSFYYRFTSSVGEYRIKIVDWEAGALYWNTRRSHGENWEQPFRQKLEVALPSSNLMFLVGNIHRFPSQWLIISLIYPPKPVDIILQPSLFDN